MTKNQVRLQCQNKRCGETFPATREWQKFCSRKCRNDFHNARRQKLIELGRAAVKGEVKA